MIIINRKLLMGAIAMICIALLGIGIFRPAQSLMLAPTDIAVYADNLASGWDNWSWDTNLDFSNTSPVHNGSYSLAVTYTQAWAGLYLHANALDLSTCDTLRFWLHGGSAGNQNISVSLNYNGSSYDVTATANTWQQVSIPLSTLGSPSSVSDLVFQENAGGAQPTFYLDDVAFVNSGLPTPTQPPPGIGPALSVNAAAARHPISPYIYGMNFADESLAAELGLPVRRWGGNSTTRYNWQTDVHNTGSDWYYENIPGSNAYGASLPDGSATDLTVEQNLRTGAETILTLPLLGWTPKPGSASHPYDCGFKVSKYGAQDSVDPWDTNCGNGVQGGSEITGNDPTDTSVAIDPSFVTAWIDHLTGKYGDAAAGGVQFYNLDNEPMLWNSTHRDVFPNPLSYDQIRDRTYLYGAAIKAADPTAQTLGPVTWGWCAYFHSAVDGCSPGSDYASHGNSYFTPWYLQQMAAYEQAHGVRILDYLDLHVYPQVDGVFSDNLGSASVQAARLRSTRQLWDSSYVHEGWIGQPVYIIPRMQQWIAANYPGTKTAITEYNWGAHGYLNGALAQADILGIFGREGLDLATLWGPPDASQPAAYAFRMFLNYDGGGSGFGETSVQAISSDQDKLAIYAAQRQADEALTLIVINKTAQTLTSNVALANFTPEASAQVYRYSAANLNAIVQEADQGVSASGFEASFPAYSITLLILSPLDHPDLSPSSKAASPTLVSFGETLTYTIQIANQGSPLTETISLTDTIPAGLAYVPGSLAATTGMVDDSNAPALYWHGLLPSLPEVTISYVVTVSGDQPQVVTNTAQIAAPGQPLITRSATVLINGHSVYLPLVVR